MKKEEMQAAIEALGKLIQQDMTCILTSGNNSQAIEQPKPEAY